MRLPPMTVNARVPSSLCADLSGDVIGRLWKEVADACDLNLLNDLRAPAPCTHSQPNRISIQDSCSFFIWPCCALQFYLCSLSLFNDGWSTEKNGWNILSCDAMWHGMTLRERIISYVHNLVGEEWCSASNEAPRQTTDAWGRLRRQWPVLWMQQAERQS